MYLRRLTLRDFRSWESLDLDLSPGVTVLLGRNGQGKTNIVEAVHYLATLSSHRVAGDQPLIRTGTESAHVAATAVNGDRELSVNLAIIAGKSNRAGINRAPVRSPREILGIVRTVMFAPEDLSLVRGDPGDRRRFVDDLAVSRWPRMAGVRADYDKVLRQRSALLKSAGPAMRRGGGEEARSALDTLEVWDQNLARFGGELLAARIDLLAALLPHLRSAYASVAPESTAADYRYRSSLGENLPERYRDLDAHREAGEPADPAAFEAALLAELAVRREREIARGVCLVGPHRDEVELGLGVHPVKGYASHGESWSYALALRLASLELLRKDGFEPVLILDDVFAELDRIRRSALATVAAETEQVLITAAVAGDVPAELHATRFAVRMVGEGAERHSELIDEPDAGEGL